MFLLLFFGTGCDNHKVSHELFTEDESTFFAKKIISLQHVEPKYGFGGLGTITGTLHEFVRLDVDEYFLNNLNKKIDSDWFYNFNDEENRYINQLISMPINQLQKEKFEYNPKQMAYWYERFVYDSFYFRYHILKKYNQKGKLNKIINLILKYNKRRDINKSLYSDAATIDILTDFYLATLNKKILPEIEKRLNWIFIKLKNPDKKNFEVLEPERKYYADYFINDGVAKVLQSFKKLEKYFLNDDIKNNINIAKKELINFINSQSNEDLIYYIYNFTSETTILFTPMESMVNFIIESPEIDLERKNKIINGLAVYFYHKQNENGSYGTTFKTTCLTIKTLRLLDFIYKKSPDYLKTRRKKFLKISINRGLEWIKNNKKFDGYYPLLGCAIKDYLMTPYETFCLLKLYSILKDEAIYQTADHNYDRLRKYYDSQIIGKMYINYKEIKNASTKINISTLDFKKFILPKKLLDTKYINYIEFFKYWSNIDKNNQSYFKELFQKVLYDSLCGISQWGYNNRGWLSSDFEHFEPKIDTALTANAVFIVSFLKDFANTELVEKAKKSIDLFIKMQAVDGSFIKIPKLTENNLRFAKYRIYFNVKILKALYQAKSLYDKNDIPEYIDKAIIKAIDHLTLKENLELLKIVYQPALDYRNEIFKDLYLVMKNYKEFDHKRSEIGSFMKEEIFKNHNAYNYHIVHGRKAMLAIGGPLLVALL